LLLNIRWNLIISAAGHEVPPERPPLPTVFLEGTRRIDMTSKKMDDQLDPKAKGKNTKEADFDRNRDGLYGGLPTARDKDAPGPDAKSPHPAR
jgi:hypothetical protein